MSFIYIPYAMGDRKGENRDSPPSFQASGFPMRRILTNHTKGNQQS